MSFKDFLNSDRDERRRVESLSEKEAWSRLAEFVLNYRPSPALNKRIEGIVDPDAPKVSEHSVWIPYPTCTVCGSLMDTRQPGYPPDRNRFRIYCHNCRREEWVKTIPIEVADASANDPEKP